jgi:hypothetical protein
MSASRRWKMSACCGVMPENVNATGNDTNEGTQTRQSQAEGGKEGHRKEARQGKEGSMTMRPVIVALAAILSGQMAVMASWQADASDIYDARTPITLEDVCP